MAGDQAIEQRKAAIENRPYTYKSGEFRLLASTSLAAEYNDNVTLVHQSPEDDFLLRPLLNLDASYPVTTWNLLRLRLGVGYDYYFNHNELNSLRLQSGSELSFDVYVNDVWLNLHDRFNYTQNSGTESGVAGTGLYGGLDNTAGISATWDLQDLILTLGYDHQNFIPSSKQFNYTERASELLVARAGFQVHPRLTTGVEASGWFTSYDQPVLNDNDGYSAGVYADWQPGTVFRVTPRAGYTAYLFDQTSLFIRAVDQSTWYADLTVTHALSDVLSYSLSAGHEIRPGIEADFIEDTYVRPAVRWNVLKNLTMNASISYENGSQGGAEARGGVHEDYDWFGGSLGLSTELIRNLSAGIDYRFILRNSTAASRNYTQNGIGIHLKYTFQ